MRNYAKIGPQFWIGSTGRRLREAAPEAALVSLYLLSNPHANMLGLYYLPQLYIAHETGLGTEAASKGLQRAIEAGFCDYDIGSEIVFVYEMARYQIADQLDPKDKRCPGIQRSYDALPNNPFLSKFYDKYVDAFHLKNRRDNTNPIEGSAKGHQSQEQEQEQNIKTLPQAQLADEPGRSTRRNSKPTEVEIDQIYKLYPRKRDKLAAKKAIRKAVCVVKAGDADHPAMTQEEALDYLAQRVTLYARCAQGCDRKYLPYPERWFSAGSFWDDEQDWNHRQAGELNGGTKYMTAVEKRPIDFTLTQDELAMREGLRSRAAGAKLN